MARQQSDTSALTRYRAALYRRILDDAQRGDPIWRLNWHDLPGSSGVRPNGKPYTGINSLTTGEFMLRNGAPDPRFYSEQAILSMSSPGAQPLRLRDGASKLVIEHWTAQPFWSRPGVRVTEMGSPVSVRWANHQGVATLEGGRQLRTNRLRVQSGEEKSVAWEDAQQRHGRVYAAVATVFNIRDIDGVRQPPAPELDRISLETITQALRQTGLRVLYCTSSDSNSDSSEGTRYDPSRDAILSPEDRPANVSQHMESLVAASLAGFRQGWDVVSEDVTRTQQGRNQLAHVLGACLLSARTGVAYRPSMDDSALIETLRDDPMALFHAASVAWRAVASIDAAVHMHACETSQRAADHGTLILASHDGSFCIEDLRTGESPDRFSGVAYDPAAGRFAYVDVTPHARQIRYLSGTTLTDCEEESKHLTRKSAQSSESQSRNRDPDPWDAISFDDPVETVLPDVSGYSPSHYASPDFS